MRDEYLYVYYQLPAVRFIQHVYLCLMFVLILNPEARGEMLSGFWLQQQKCGFSLVITGVCAPAFVHSLFLYIVLSTVSKEKHPPPLFPEKKPQEQSTAVSEPS